MDTVSTPFSDLLTQAPRLTYRERVLFLLTLVATIGGGWYHFALAPFLAERTQLRLYRTQNVSERQLRSEIHKLDQRLAQMAGVFIPSGKMTGLLTDVLNAQGRLRLVSLAAHPPKPFLNCFPDAPMPPGWMIYQHAVTLTLRGNFADTLQYLQTLEATPWPIQWNSLTYRVDHHPDAVIILKLHTLGLEEALLKGGKTEKKRD